MNPDFKKYIDTNKTSLIKKICECSENIVKNAHKIETKSFYKDLYEKLLIKYSSLYASLYYNVGANGANEFYPEEFVSIKYQADITYRPETKSYYEYLYKELSKRYSLLLDEIGATKLYFNHQKKTNSNSLFRLLYKLKKKEDNSYDIKKAQKNFETITSPSLSDLTEYFQEIVKKNHSTLIYYRYNSNCDITNHLSLEPFSLSSKSTLGYLSRHYDL
ncbi:46355_t:CDS:1, partial [Gigaspora margarita]